MRQVVLDIDQWIVGSRIELDLDLLRRWGEILELRPYPLRCCSESVSVLNQA